LATFARPAQTLTATTATAVVTTALAQTIRLAMTSSGCIAVVCVRALTTASPAAVVTAGPVLTVGGATGVTAACSRVADEPPGAAAARAPTAVVAAHLLRAVRDAFAG
jgi:hypothetical protein